MDTNFHNSNHQDDEEPGLFDGSFYRKTNFWWGVLAVLVLIILIQHWPFGNHKQAPGVPVVVATVTRANVPVVLSELGSVVPTATVTVKTLINGYLLQVLYKEGQMVKKGEVLAEIDPRPYQAQLIQYEGQLMRDQALLQNAELDLKRYQKLWKQDSVAKQTLDTQVALIKQDQGNVKSDEGLIQATKLNLIYCEISSPVDGRVGLRLVDPGNFVQTSDASGIAVITTMSPMTVIFSIPEDDVPAVMEQINAGQILIVKAYDRQQNKLLSVGKLLTIDNQIDPTTGTVKLRAQFDNHDNKLFPNQFVNVQLYVKILQNVMIVPTAAIQHGVQNNFVYRLNTDNTVTVKPVEIGIAYGENTVITKGVSPRQIVVVEGADNLKEGAKVAVTQPRQANVIKEQTSA